jgi:DNA helicase-2/ATP-dependent DNA helicase PcrA
MDLLTLLNTEQRQAVITTEGPVLVLAGAGSGKTRVIAHRIAYLIQAKEVWPSAILAVTFTNKAAKEMQLRVANLLAQQDTWGGTPFIATFHSLCVRILRQHIDKLPANAAGTYYTGQFTIYDSDDQARIIRDCLKTLHIDDKMLPPRMVQSAIGNAKSRGLSWDAYAEQSFYAKDMRRQAISQIYQLYEQRLAASNALDFDDLLLKTVQLLATQPTVRDHYNDRFRYILIDEYQDTNPPQLALIRLLTEKSQHLCVVGDPDQSIYRFRSADIHNILDFEKYYPQACAIKLVQNYRSTQHILEMANKVIRNNVTRHEKDLRTDNPRGDKIRYYQAYDGENEAEFVAKSITAHIYAQPQVRCAVLYRTNAQSRLLEEACRRQSLRYNVVGGFSFYERAEIKDTIAYLKLLVNPYDNIALMRIINTPTRGIGKATLDSVVELAENTATPYWEAILQLLQNNTLNARAANSLRAFIGLITQLQDRLATLSLPELVKAIINETGYLKMLAQENTPEAENRLVNLEELVSAAVESQEREETLYSFLDHAALVSDVDSYENDVPVTLMTIHSAKGLEFPVVFIVGLEQGLFPHSRALADRNELEEERRLCYVAITRAERQLYLSHALMRRIYGAESSCEPSQFLYELPAELIEDLSRGESVFKALRQGRKPARSVANNSISYRPAGYASTNHNNTSVESVRQFFNKSDNSAASRPNAPSPGLRNTNSVNNISRPKALISQHQSPLAAAPTTKTGTNNTPSAPKGGFKAGMRVRHSKYGEGLILRREGEGEEAKLLISFSGFGQKKLVEKYANLVKL